MLEQMGEMGTMIDPDIILQLNQFFMLATFLVTLLIIFTAFISIKADQIVGWNWFIVFTPAFILDAILLIGVSRIGLPDKEEIHDQDSDRTTNDGESQLPNAKIRKQAKIVKSIVLVYLLLFVLFQVLIVVNLDGLTNLKGMHAAWGSIFLPYYILEIFHFGVTTFQLVRTLQLGKSEFIINQMGEATQTLESFTSIEILKEIFGGYMTWVLRVCQVVLVVLKLDGALTSTWAVVFIPFYLSGIFKFVIMLLEYRTMQQLKRASADPMSVGTGGIIFKLIGFSLGCILFYVGLGLLINRLDAMTGLPTTAVIFIPLFIVLSLLFCCFCCCAPCIVSQGQMAFEEQLMQGGGDIRLNQIVPVDHRLT